MPRLLHPITSFALIFLSLTASQTSAESLDDIGTIPGADSIRPFLTNSDGSTISGNVSAPGNIAFRWTQATGMQSLGMLPGGLFSDAAAMDVTGSTIVGRSGSTAGQRAFRWTEATGMQSLGVLTGGFYSAADDVSADGSVITGFSEFAAGLRAFRWTQTGGMTSLGVLTGGTESRAEAVSGDGSTIIGQSESTGGDRAFRWTQGTGMVSLGVLTGETYSDAKAVSYDGTVIIGKSGSSSGSKAFRWTQGTGMQNLGVLTGHAFSEATTLNSDGSVVIGKSIGSGVSRAFRWTQSTGMQNLGTLSGNAHSSAKAVSEDGSVIVGDSEGGASGTRAFKWTEATGMQSLGTLTGGSYSRASTISADGKVILGYSNSSSGERAFIFINQIQDLENLQNSVVDVANGVAASVDRNTHIARRLRQDTCTIADQAQGCIGLSGLASSLLQGTNAFGGSIMGSYKATDTIRVGASFGLYGESRVSQTINPDYGVGISAYADIRLGQLAAFNSQANIGVRIDGSWFYTDAEITRGAGYSDVQQESGSSNFNTGTAGLQVYANHVATSNLLLHSYLGTYWESTGQNGYTEQGIADTNTRINSQFYNAATATMGIDAAYKLTSNMQIAFGVGLETDFYADGIQVSGTSNIPGLTDFTIGADTARNWVRPTLKAGLAYTFTNQGILELNTQVFSPRYQKKLGADLSLKYSVRF
ncbi:hypothetical protein ACMG4P_16820 [Pseudovibrio denitrificans]|uniref:hypothetical protein n=1 Tax=Pseudovibrio denitrificans TaxID=258256 RepID=UPI0039BF99E2